MHINKLSKFSLFLIPTLFLSTLCQANWTFLPESHHQLYDSWGLFFDEQSMLLNYGQGRVWSALGGTMPIFGNEESLHHPEIIFHASANAAIHYNDNFRLWTETLDARLGIAIEWELNPNLRFSIGYQHFSGHSVDGINVADSDLIQPTLGQEFIPIKIIYDIGRMFRLSGTVSPVVRSSPSIEPIWMDQSIEFFPWGLWIILISLHLIFLWDLVSLE